ncbi:MAG: hypothetical protein OET79_16875 [Nitrospirota bacterium]|nr:hypothetical protein [Nitrospirota bacterium]
MNRHYGTEILVSEAVAERTRDRFLMRSVDKVVPKGIAHPIRIYELLGGLDDTQETERIRCGRWEDAYGAYLKREWQAALDVFRSLSTKSPDDELAKIYVGRAERYLTEPPRPDWQGVETYLSK